LTVLRDFEFLVLGLFASSAITVRDALAGVLAEAFGPGMFAFKEAELDIGTVYVRRPPRGGAHAKRLVIFEPSNAPGRTAMLTNLEDGWMTLVNVLAQRLPGEHLLLRTSVDEVYSVTDLEVWHNGSSARYVGALKEDPSWEFNQRGTPRSYEDQAQYEKRRIRDRFNREVAVATLRRAGWAIDEPGFWRAKGPAFYAFEKREVGGSATH
jgi:hypothetical protein